MEGQITSLISTLGFPIAVTVWLLYERGRTIKELTKAINNLTLLIQEKVK